MDHQKIVKVSQPRWWEFDNWESHMNDPWGPGAERGSSPHDCHDFHVDLGCGTRPKGRIGIDRFDSDGVDYVMELDDPEVRLPFPNGSIQSIISHHFFEHIGEGFIPLVDEIYRVLQPGGILRAITPLFPCTAAVEDPDHCRYFLAGTWDAFCGFPNVPHWSESFSVPYTQARFKRIDRIMTPRIEDVKEHWGPHDQREIRVTLEAMK